MLPLSGARALSALGMLAFAAGMPLGYSIADCATREGTLYDTGFLPSTLQTAWDKYSGPDNTIRNRLPRSPKHDHKRVVWFFAFLMWIHRNHDPRGTGFRGLGQGKFSAWFDDVTPKTFKAQVLVVGGAFAAVVEEVAQYSRALRDDPYNHAPWFRHPRHAILDTLPIYVTEPSSWHVGQRTAAISAKI